MLNQIGGFFTRVVGVYNSHNTNPRGIDRSQLLQANEEQNETYCKLIDAIDEKKSPLYAGEFEQLYKNLTDEQQNRIYKFYNDKITKQYSLLYLSYIYMIQGNHSALKNVFDSGLKTNNACVIYYYSRSLRNGDYGIDQDIKQADTYRDKALALNHGHTTFLHARLLLPEQRSSCTEDDEKAALKWALKSAELGCLQGMNLAIELMIDPEKILPMYQVALVWLKKIAQLNCDEISDKARFNAFKKIISFYEKGRSGGDFPVTKDYPRALEWLEKFSVLNNSLITNKVRVDIIKRMLSYYKEGRIGVAKNPYKVIECLQKLADLGDLEAKHELVRYYEFGWEDVVPRDYAMAATLCRELVETYKAHNDRGTLITVLYKLINLERMLALETQSEIDLTNLYLQLMDECLKDMSVNKERNADILYKLGKLLLVGDCCPQDQGNAFTCWQIAQNNGNHNATAQLAQLNVIGGGIFSQNFDLAYHNFLKCNPTKLSSESLNLIYRFALIYKEAKGTEQNDERFLRLLNLAREGNYPDAANLLANMYISASHGLEPSLFKAKINYEVAAKYYNLYEDGISLKKLIIYLAKTKDLRKIRDEIVSNFAIPFKDLNPAVKKEWKINPQTKKKFDQKDRVLIFMKQQFKDVVFVVKVEDYLTILHHEDKQIHKAYLYPLDLKYILFATKKMVC